MGKLRFVAFAVLFSIAFSTFASAKINKYHVNFSSGEGDESDNRVIDFYFDWCVNKGDGGGQTNYAEYCQSSRHTINCASCHKEVKNENR